MPELNNSDALEDNVLRNFGGAVENNLYIVLGNLSDTSEDLAIFTNSSYIDTSQLEDKRTSSKDKFTVFSLNTQSIHGHSMVLTFRVHYIRIKSLLFWDGTPFWDFFAA